MIGQVYGVLSPGFPEEMMMGLTKEALSLEVWQCPTYKRWWCKCKPATIQSLTAYLRIFEDVFNETSYIIIDIDINRTYICIPHLSAKSLKKLQISVVAQACTCHIIRDDTLKRFNKLIGLLNATIGMVFVLKHTKLIVCNWDNLSPCESIETLGIPIWICENTWFVKLTK